MEAGHLQECNKQLFEDQLRRIIVEAKAKVKEREAKSHPGAESTGERTVLETQISSEGVSAGISSQQVMCTVCLGLIVFGLKDIPLEVSPFLNI